MSPVTSVLQDSSPLPEGRLRKAVRLVLWLTLLWVVVAVLGALPPALSGTIDWRDCVSFAILDWAPWILLSPIVVWFATLLRVDGRNWKYIVPLHVVAAVLVALCEQGLGHIAIDQGWVQPPHGEHGSHEEKQAEAKGSEAKATQPQAGDSKSTESKGERGHVSESMIRFFHLRLTMPIYFLLVAATHAVDYHRRSMERERRILEAEARLTEARLMALQTQLQPHFLFNTLNAISSLIYSNQAAADEMLCLLSTLLRSVLDVSERREIPLSEELVFVENYLKIQRLRFPDRLRVKVDIEAGLEKTPVPTLILQPLVENAVIHGIAPFSSGGEVSIRARREKGACVIEVSNTGRDLRDKMLGKDGELIVRERVGLANIRSRLAALHGDAQSFGLYPNQEGGGICARLRFPERKETTP